VSGPERQATTRGSLTQRLAVYAAAAVEKPIPEQVREKAKHHILDTVAAVVSGSALEPGLRARDYVSSLGGREEASVVGTGLRTSAVNAALANAMAAHADETDDAHPASITHPGCAVVPAALAMAERQGSSGADFLRAVVLGYDFCARIGVLLGAGRFLTERGFDPHAFGGGIGAAVAAGSLVVREPRPMAHLLSYAAQQSSGLATLFRDRGHIEKAFVFAGMPARNGVSAATMVQSGMTGVADVFDGKPSFLSAYGVNDDEEKVFDDLGVVFEITRTNIKRWSVGSPVQAVLDALESLLSQHRFAPSDVSAVVIHLPEEGARVVDNRDMPSVNVQHLAALMLIDGTVGFHSSHDAKRMQDPNVLVMRAKVTLLPSAELSRAEPARQAIVEIALTDGRALRHHTRAVRGTTTNPMTWDELTTKALDLMTPIMSERQARRVVEALSGVEQLPSLASLVSLLTRSEAEDSASIKARA
jgi:2-methylcitrate dehydratase PrpD